MSRRRLEIRQVGNHPIPERLLRDLAEDLRDHLDVDIAVGHTAELPSRAGSEDPILAGEVLDALITASGDPPRASDWVLGVGGFDLTSEQRDFVFGAATVGGSWAVVGTARFGIASRPGTRFRERVLKESLHELGHVAGLGHCSDPECGMSAAFGVDAIDARPLRFCERCTALLTDAISA